MAIQHLISRWAGLTVFLLVSASAQAEEITAHKLLNDLVKASEELHYSGTFTYQQGGSLESFKVFHWSEGGEQIERLEYLNGPERQLTQRLGGDDCAPLGHRLLQKRLVASGGAAEIDQFYQIVMQGVERVAGREGRIVQIIPRDQMRYGHVWSLDQETGLLLKALVFDEHQRLVERFQFVELNLVDDPAEFAQMAEPNLEQRPAGRSVDCATEPSDEPSRWALRWLPPGFAFSGEKFLDESSQMLMYTDGLSAFSVFVQPRAERVVIEGRAHRGATSIHMSAVSDGRQDYRLTVVGEIPGAVAERLAQAVAPRNTPVPRSSLAPENAPTSGASAKSEDPRPAAELVEPTVN